MAAVRTAANQIYPTYLEVELTIIHPDLEAN